MSIKSWSTSPWVPLSEGTRRAPLPPAPRHVPASLRRVLMTLGVPSTIGALFLAMGMFVLFSFTNALQMSRAVFSHLDAKMVDANVVSVSATSVTVNEDPVMAVSADYSAAGRSLRVTSFTTAPMVSEGDVVGVRYSNTMPSMAVIDGLSASTVPSWGLTFLLIFPVVGAGLLMVQVRRGRQQAHLLAHGVEAEGTFVSKEATGTRVNDIPVMKVTFHFVDARGDTWPATARALDTSRLEDESTERVLYLPEQPAEAMVVDEIPSWLESDRRGWISPPSGVAMRPIFMAVGVAGASALGVALSFLSST